MIQRSTIWLIITYLSMTGFRIANFSNMERKKLRSELYLSNASSKSPELQFYSVKSVR